MRIYALQYIFGSLTLRDILERLKIIINRSISYSWDKLIWNASFLMLMIEENLSQQKWMKHDLFFPTPILYRKVANIVKEQILSFIDLKNQNVIIWKISSVGLKLFSWLNETDRML